METIAYIGMACSAGLSGLCLWKLYELYCEYQEQQRIKSKSHLRALEAKL